MPNTVWPVLVPEATARQRILAFAIAAKRWLWYLAGRPAATLHPGSSDQLRDAIASTGCSFDPVTYHGNPKGQRQMGAALLEAISFAFNSANWRGVRLAIGNPKRLGKAARP